MLFKNRIYTAQCRDGMEIRLYEMQNGNGEVTEMTALKRELRKRCIVFSSENAAEMFVTATETVIVTVYYCDVMEPEFHIYDRKTFKPIGCQNVIPEPVLFGKGKTWGSGIYAD